MFVSKLLALLADYTVLQYTVIFLYYTVRTACMTWVTTTSLIGSQSVQGHKLSGVGDNKQANAVCAKHQQNQTNRLVLWLRDLEPERDLDLDLGRLGLSRSRLWCVLVSLASSSCSRSLWRRSRSRCRICIAMLRSSSSRSCNHTPLVSCLSLTLTVLALWTYTNLHRWTYLSCGGYRQPSRQKPLRQNPVFFFIPYLPACWIFCKHFCCFSSVFHWR